MLSFALALAGFVAGITGAWSPCGFSMVETLAPHGYAGRLRTTLLACAAFTLGSVAGGMLTFGGLALLGAWLGGGGAGAVSVALALALAAAVGEAHGLRIVPQVRRQVPEAWRRVLPVPLAAGLYGVLLGLGFTTFILTFAVPALALVSVALAAPGLGLTLGLGFGLGRALPVIALAPAAGTARGAGAAAAMAERPAILRGLRRLDALALALLALALLPASALAADLVASGATDPSADGERFAWHRPGGLGVLADAAGPHELPGSRPALGGGRAAWLEGEMIVVATAGDGTEVARFPAPGADALAVAEGWAAWRARRPDGTTALVARGLPAGPERVLAVVAAPAQLGRPALAGTTVVVAVAGRTASRLEAIDLLGFGRSVLRREPGAVLSSPAVHGRALLYVRAAPSGQTLRLGALAPRRTSGDRVLYATVAPARSDPGHEPGERRKRHGHPRARGPQPPEWLSVTLWSTALGPDAAFVTRLRQPAGGTTQADILRVVR